MSIFKALKEARGRLYAAGEEAKVDRLSSQHTRSSEQPCAVVALPFPATT